MNQPTSRWAGALIGFLLLAALAIGCQSQSSASAADPPPEPIRASITDFGAVSDGKALNTQAIQKAIDHLAAAGGGTVVIPQGVFLSGAIFLKPGVNLELDQGAVLKGSTDTSDYPTRLTRIEGHSQPWLPALVNADGVDHLRISGQGTLDGSGQVFWTAFRQRARAVRGTKNLDVPRPRLMFIANGADARISGIHFKNSGYWNLHLYRCHDALIDGLDISTLANAAGGSPSTDGMDIDSCRNVTIRRCTISVGDDCIALKGSKGPFALSDKESPPVEHVVIDGCTFLRGGGVTLGSEATIVRDVLVENCKYAGPTVLRLKLRPDTPQDYEDIQVRNVRLAGRGHIIDVAPWRQYFDLQGQPPPTSAVRGVAISGVTGAYGAIGSIQVNPGDVIEHLTLQDIDVKLNSPAVHLAAVTDLVFKNVKVNGAVLAQP